MDPKKIFAPLDRFFQEHFWVLVVLSVGTTAAWLLFDRWRVGKRVPKPPPISQSEILFQENFLTGATDRNFITRLSAGGNCITIIITFNGVLIRLMAPFRWATSSSIGDMPHYFSISQIRQIKPRRHYPGSKGYEIEYEDHHGKVRWVWLKIRKPDQFLKALRRAGAPACCLTCGYNLTGITSNRCPECGTDLLPLGT